MALNLNEEAKNGSQPSDDALGPPDRKRGAKLSMGDHAAVTPSVFMGLPIAAFLPYPRAYRCF